MLVVLLKLSLILSCFDLFKLTSDFFFAVTQTFEQTIEIIFILMPNFLRLSQTRGKKVKISDLTVYKEIKIWRKLTANLVNLLLKGRK